MNKHAPTPWKVYHEVNIEAENGRHIAALGVTPGFEESKANAAFIVRAVNSFENHKRLIAESDTLGSENTTIKKINSELLYALISLRDTVKHSHVGYCYLCETIAKAEGIL